MRQLTALDAQFLNVESATTAAHVAGLAILDATDGRLTRRALAELLLERLHLAPAFSLRLVEVPLGLDRPYWADDPEFDIDNHLFELTLPAPGGELQLAEAVAEIHARRLDRTRPLWEMHLIHGLAGGRAGVYTKVHHAAIDGVSGAETLAALLDLTPAPECATRAAPTSSPRPKTTRAAAASAARSVIHAVATPPVSPASGGPLEASGPAASSGSPGPAGASDSPGPSGLSGESGTSASSESSGGAGLTAGLHDRSDHHGPTHLGEVPLGDGGESAASEDTTVREVVLKGVAAGTTLGPVPEVLPHVAPDPANRAVRDEVTLDGVSQDGVTPSRITQDPATQNGATQNGATQNGATQNGATQNGSTQNGATQNGATQDLATQASAIRASGTQDGVGRQEGADGVVREMAAGAGAAKTGARGKVSGTAGVEAPGLLGMLSGAAVHGVTHPVRALQSIVRAAGDLDAIPLASNVPGSRLIAKAARMVAGDSRERPPLPGLAAPRTPFNGPISDRRRLAFGSVSWKEVKNVARSHSMSGNDVVMALCTTALRSWLVERDALPDEPLIAAVPVAVRSARAQERVGNQISAMIAPLPTNTTDPQERLRAVGETMNAAKRRFALAPASWLGELCALLPPPVTGLVTPAIFRFVSVACPPINLIISNVPGPQFPLYLCGSRVLSYYPMSVLSDATGGVNITCFSYDGMLDFGIVACPERMDDVWGLLGHLQQALDELVDKPDEYREEAGVLSAE